MKSVTRVAFSVFAATTAAGLVATAILRTTSSWSEYYGEGPPYYGMTTNMDKWESPLPRLMLWNGGSLLVLAALGYGVARIWRASSR